MKNKINIAEIVKNLPQGYLLYSPTFGEMTFHTVTNDETIITKDRNFRTRAFYSDGRFLESNIYSEMMLFPSEKNRDWNTFLQPARQFWRYKPEDQIVDRKTNETYTVLSIHGNCYNIIKGEHMCWKNFEVTFFPRDEIHKYYRLKPDFRDKDTVRRKDGTSRRTMTIFKKEPGEDNMWSDFSFVETSDNDIDNINNGWYCGAVSGGHISRRQLEQDYEVVFHMMFNVDDVICPRDFQEEKHFIKRIEGDLYILDDDSNVSARQQDDWFKHFLMTKDDLLREREEESHPEFDTKQTKKSRQEQYEELLKQIDEFIDDDITEHNIGTQYSLRLIEHISKKIAGKTFIQEL